MVCQSSSSETSQCGAHQKGLERKRGKLPNYGEAIHIKNTKTKLPEKESSEEAYMTSFGCPWATDNTWE